MVRHLATIDNFSKEDIQEVIRRAQVFEQADDADFADLCKGKVMATLFFQESTRTMLSFQSAMAKLGGDWVGLTPEGSYVDAGDEDVEDTLLYIPDFADIMVVRHKSFDLVEYSKDCSVPLINGMCGEGEHSAGVLWIVTALSHHFEDFEGVDIGIYGMVKPSRPLKGMIKALTRLGANFYIDSVTEEFGVPEEIMQGREKQIQISSLNDFIGDVDVFFIAEGLPQPGFKEEDVDRYTQEFEQIGSEEMSMLRDDVVAMPIGPKYLKDGRRTIDKEVEESDKIKGHEMMESALYANMGIITYLLGIDVEK